MPKPDPRGYTSLAPLPTPVKEKQKASHPTGMVKASEYEARLFRSQFAKGDK